VNSRDSHVNVFGGLAGTNHSFHFEWGRRHGRRAFNRAILAQASACGVKASQGCQNCQALLGAIRCCQGHCHMTATAAVGLPVRLLSGLSGWYYPRICCRIVSCCLCCQTVRRLSLLQATPHTVSHIVCVCVTGLRGRRTRTGHACGDAQTTQQCHALSCTRSLVEL
jgi:hypothetical protein